MTKNFLVVSFVLFTNKDYWLFNQGLSAVPFNLVPTLTLSYVMFAKPILCSAFVDNSLDEELILLLSHLEQQR